MDWNRYADQIIAQHRASMIPQSMQGMNPQFMPQSQPISPFGQARQGQRQMSDLDAQLLGISTGKKKKRDGLSQWLPTIGAIGGGLLAMPFTGGASLPMAIALSGLGAGIGGAVGEMGSQSINNESADMGAVGNEALTSGLFGAVGGGVGGLLGKGAKVGSTALSNVDDAGKVVVKGVAQNVDDVGGLAGKGIKSRLLNREGLVKEFTKQGSPYGFNNAQQASALLDKYGVQGSLYNQAQKVPEVASKLGTQVDDLLRANTNTIKASALSKELKALANPGVLSKKELGLIDDVLRNTKGNVTAEQLMTLKRGLKYNSTSDIGRASKEVYNNLNKVIDRIAPEARALNSEYGAFAGTAKVLGQGAGKTSGIPLVGLRSGKLARAMQGTRDFVGRSLERAGGMQIPQVAGSGKIGGVLAKPGVAPTLAQVIGHSVTQPPAEPVTDPTLEADPMESPELDMETMMAEQEAQQMEAQGEDLKNQFSQAMMEDLQTTGGKNIPELKTIYDMLKPNTSKLKEKAGGDSKDVRKIQKAKATVNQVFQAFDNAGGGQGRLGGAVASVAGLAGLNSPVKAYEGVSLGYLSQIIRAMGEVGTLTDYDIKRIQGAMPSVYDTPEEAKIKRSVMMNILNSSMEISKSGGSGGSDTPSNLDEAIAQAQGAY